MNEESITIFASIMSVLNVPCVIVEVTQDCVKSNVVEAAARQYFAGFVAANGGGTLILASREASGNVWFSGPPEIVNQLQQMGWQRLGLTPQIVATSKSSVYRSGQKPN